MPKIGSILKSGVVLCPGFGKIAPQRCGDIRKAGSCGYCDVCAVHTRCPRCGSKLWLKDDVDVSMRWECRDKECGWKSNSYTANLLEETIAAMKTKRVRERERKRKSYDPKKEATTAKSKGKTCPGFPAAATCGVAITNRAKLCKACDSNRRAAEAKADPVAASKRYRGKPAPERPDSPRKRGKVGEAEKRVIEGMRRKDWKAETIARKCGRSIEVVNAVLALTPSLAEKPQPRGETPKPEPIDTVTGTFGISRDDIEASLSTLAGAGMQSKIAIVSLRRLIYNIAQPSGAAKEKLQALGIEYGPSALLKGRFRHILRLLHDSAGDNAEEIIELIPSLKATTAYLALTRDLPSRNKIDKSDGADAIVTGTPEHPDSPQTYAPDKTAEAAQMEPEQQSAAAVDLSLSCTVSGSKMPPEVMARTTVVVEAENGFKLVQTCKGEMSVVASSLRKAAQRLEAEAHVIRADGGEVNRGDSR